MQNVKAVIAVSYERIHRSNLVLFGVMPLQFKNGESADSLGLTGNEKFSIDLGDDIRPRQDVVVKVEGGAISEFVTTLRIDTDSEVTYYKVRALGCPTPPSCAPLLLLISCTTERRSLELRHPPDAVSHRHVAPVLALSPRHQYTQAPSRPSFTKVHIVIIHRLLDAHSLGLLLLARLVVGELSVFEFVIAPPSLDTE